MSEQCFSCGHSQNDDVRKLLAGFKRQFEQKGISRYFYKLSSTGTTYICRASSFNALLENHIKPEFKNGAEWAHISELN